MKVQVIGFPAAGKTKAIQQYLASIPEPTLWPRIIDIRHFPNKNREWLFKQEIKNFDDKNIDLIAESACGVRTSNTVVIKLDASPDDVLSRNEMRLHPAAIDKEYLSLIAGQMIPADYTISSWDQLHNLMISLKRI